MAAHHHALKSDPAAERDAAMTMAEAIMFPRIDGSLILCITLPSAKARCQASLYAAAEYSGIR